MLFPADASSVLKRSRSTAPSRGTRLSVAALFEQLDQGSTIAEFVEWVPFHQLATGASGSS
jgi:hypothetical protein